MNVLGKDDDVRYIGPPSEPFQYAAADCATLRDEMYRVVHHMANSVDNSGAALQRSGESKAVDLNATNIVLKFLGEEIAKHAVEVMECVCAGRKDVESDGECKYDWHMMGMEEFNQGVDADSFLKEITALGNLDINSPTAQWTMKLRAYRLHMGDDAKEEWLEKVERELKSNNPPESFDPQRKLDMQDAMAAAAMTPDSPGNPDDGDDEEEDTDPDKKPEKAPPAKKPAKKAKAK
jgi:hypothetical protein